MLVTGGYIDPKTGEGRVEYGAGRVIRLTRRNLVRVRTRYIVTRVVAKVRGRTVRLKLNHAQMLFAGGTTTLTLDRDAFPEGGEGTFRITGGRLQSETLRGELAHRGTLSIGPIALQDIGFLPGDGVTAQVGDVRTLVAWSPPSGPGRFIGGVVRIGPALLRLTEESATRLNFYFETDRFRKDMPVGTLVVRGRLRG